MMNISVTDSIIRLSVHLKAVSRQPCVTFLGSSLGQMQESVEFLFLARFKSLFRHLSRLEQQFSKCEACLPWGAPEGFRGSTATEKIVQHLHR